MSRYIKVDDVMALINTSNRGNCDYFIVDKIEELCISNKTTDEQEIRAKAIDEFVRRLKNHPYAQYHLDSYLMESISEVAEQMKAGGKNE